MATEEIDRKLAVGIQWAFVGLVFFLPLLVSTRSSEVFELPKILFVYAMTAVMVGLWLSRMAVRRERRTFLKEILIRRTPLDIPILLFLISQMASTIYSIDPAVSWWGWYGRFHGGLMSTVSYTLLYYAFVSNYSSPLSLPVIGSLFSVFGSKSIGYQSVGRKPINRKPADQNPTTDNGKLTTVILAAAAIVSIYAVLQHFGIDKNFWVQDVVNRVFSTQGQPNWLAAYVVMTMPLAFVITSSKFKVQSSKFISYGMIVILFLALLWTKSRSGLVGLAVADLVFWGLVFIRSYLSKNKSYIDQQRSFKPQPTFLGTKKLYRFSTIVHNLYNFDKKTSPAAAFFFIHSILLILILATNNPAREWIFQKSQLISAKISSNQIMDKSDRSESEFSNISIVRFLADFSRDSDFSGNELRKSEFGGTESGDIRRIVWSGAIELAKQRPIFGFGPETFGESYWQVRPKEHNLTSEWNFLYNKAHNEWLNLAANTGLFGLGSHLLLVGWFAIWILLSVFRFQFSVKSQSVVSLPVMKPINRKPTDQNLTTENREQITGLLIAILAALAGVEAVNFFGFSTVTIGVYRYLFMALAVSIATDNANKLLKTIADRIVSSVMIVGIGLAAAYIVSQVIIFFIADLEYNRGRAYQDGGYVKEAVEPLMTAVNLVPAEPAFRAELAEAEGAFASQVQSSKFKVQSEDQTLINELRNEAIKNLGIVRRQSPQNLGFIRTQARILFLLGEEARAVDLMKQAITMAPTNPQLPYSLGVMLSKMGRDEEAAVYYSKAVELKPDYPAAIPISE